MSNVGTNASIEAVYEAATQWVDCALRGDGSLFTPGKSIWSERWLGQLRKRYLDQPDESDDDFYTKLKRQLEGSPAEVYQLMAELLYVHFLIVWHDAMGGPTKEGQIRKVLAWSSEQIPLPKSLTAGLMSGIARPGGAFFFKRPFQVGFLIEFAERWKQQSTERRRRLLGDPWAFKEFLHFEPTGKMFDESKGDGTYRIQRNAVLHLVFPDTFEKILSIAQKSKIAEAFAEFVTEADQDIDRQLVQIRQGIEAQLGREFDFYADDIRAQWDPHFKSEHFKSKWDEFVRRGQVFVEKGQLDSEENNYKIEIGKKLDAARTAVLAETDDWAELVKGGITGNLVHSITLAKLRDWVKQSPDQALRALQELWKPDHPSISERIRSFAELFPKSAIDSGGAGTRLNVISQFLMGLDVKRYPPYRITLFNKAYDLTGSPKPAKNADEAMLYEQALDFLDQLIDEAEERGVHLRHRLDAQSLLWMIVNSPVPPPPPKHDLPTPPPEHDLPTLPPKHDLPTLAEELLLPKEFLQEIDTLLKEKRQVIFQGPPGTGKTYVAQRLAACLAKSEERVTLVQFHPSYAYEDFVQGFRPTLASGGQPGFKLTDGPLLAAAKRARDEEEEDHFLVIDEINRGNLGKVLGELYFLLEYRDQNMRLQYQAEDEEGFSLPENLYIIGTMNTADRSIALVDLALRRRFHFVEFHPDHDPIKGLLRRWLDKNAPGMEWVADVVKQANLKLADDRHVAIGPSYFMGENRTLDRAAVERIWKHNVLPYIEEHLFGSQEGLDEWRLDALQKKAEAPGHQSSAADDKADSTTDAPD
jgi:hypothetical protein